ncbi:hypothetical protein [Pelodictyon luteolum]|nr:hypothetical protein [Pelodictyon luteolum]
MGIRRKGWLFLPIFFFILASCGSGIEDAGLPSELYRQAREHSHRGEYQQALGCYARGLEGENLSEPSFEAVRALNEKRSLEGLTGSYAAAFATTDLLAGLPKGSLTDSLRTSMAVDRSRWLGELGQLKEAADALDTLKSLLPEVRLQQASYALRGGFIDRAEGIYGSLVSSQGDPIIQMHAWSGLLQCGARRPGVVENDLLDMARKIVALSGRVMSTKDRTVERVQALRHAASSLQLTQKHRRDASFLLFRALSIAGESGRPFLVEVLRLESNAAIVRKSDPFRESASYFEMKNMPYAEAMAKFMLSGSEGVDPEERTTALQGGFVAARDAAPPWPRPWMRQLERDALFQLNGQLLANSRIFELFDASQQSSMLRLSRALLRRADLFRPKGAEPDTMMAEVRTLLQNMGGLRQRKVDMLVNAGGEERRRAADRSLNMQYGRLLELLSSLRISHPVAAEVLSFNPVTLRTVQHALKDDEVVLAPVLSDSLAALLVIGRRNVQIASSRLPFDSEHPAASLDLNLRRELGASSSPEAMRGGEWEWFARSMEQPAREAVKNYRRVIVVSDALLPLHLFDGVGNPSSGRQVSFLHSYRELVILRANEALPPAASEICFYDADDQDGPAAHKMFFPRDRVFIIWKPYGEEALEEMKREIGTSMQETVSGAAALQALRRDNPRKWAAVSAYGVQ